MKRSRMGKRKMMMVMIRKRRRRSRRRALGRKKEERGETQRKINEKYNKKRKLYKEDC